MLQLSDLHEGAARELCAVVGDDPVRDPDVGFRSNFKKFPTRTQDHVMHSNERRVLSTYPTQTECGSDDTT